jgi:putative ABC transport system permease protein
MVVRVEARARAAKEAEVSLLREEKTRKELRVEKESFNAGLISLVTIVSAFWVGLLMWINIRQRRSEIAILKAIGWSNYRVFVLVLLKAFVMGIIGGICGVLLGLAIVNFRNYEINYDYQLMVLVVSASVFISIISSWLPALSAVTMDPASILQEDI